MPSRCWVMVVSLPEDSRLAGRQRPFLKIVQIVSRDPRQRVGNPCGAHGVGPERIQTKRFAMRRGPLDNPELNPTESRQGFLDRPVLVVLVVSLALVIVAFLVLPTLV